jgi:hypothetical protein
MTRTSAIWTRRSNVRRKRRSGVLLGAYAHHSLSKASHHDQERKAEPWDAESMYAGFFPHSIKVNRRRTETGADWSNPII